MFGLYPLISVNAWNDPAPDQRRIPVPVGSVLALALLLVTLLAVDQQRAKVHQEEVREDHSPAPALGGLNGLLLQVPGGRVDAQDNSVAGNARRQAVRPRHDPVAQVVDVAGASPPAGRDQLGAAGRLDVLEVLDAGIVRVGAETVLLVVGAPEDRVAHGSDSQDEQDAIEAQLVREDGQVAGLEVVDKRHPDEVAKREHEPEAVHDDVHCSQQGRLHVQAIQDIESLESSRDDDRVRDVAVGAVLAGNVRQVQDDPPQQAGAHFEPGLDVDRARSFTDKGNWQAYPGVQLSANEEIVQRVASVTTRS